MSRGTRHLAATGGGLEDLIPHLASGWERVRLGDVARLQPGYAFKSKWFTNVGIRLLRGTNIVPGGTRWDDVACLPSDRLDEFSSYELRSGDLVIAMDRPVISSGIKVAKLRESDLPALLLQRVGRFLPERVEPDLLLAYLNSPLFLAHIGVTATGTQLPHISGSDIGSAPLPLPPLNEQKRIVAKIEALQLRSEAAKEALDAIPPLLEKFRQSVLAAAFRGDLTKAWRERHPDVEPASKLLERIRAERRRRFAEAYPKKKYVEPGFATDTEAPTAHRFGPYDDLAWVAVPLEGLVDPTRGIPYGIVKTGDPVDGGVPTVRCDDIKRFQIDLGNLKRVSPDLHGQYRRTALVGGEVLVAIRGTVGATVVASEEMSGMNISREVAMVPPLPGVNSKYLCYLLASPVGQALMQGHVKGVAQSGINLGDLRTLPMPLPSGAEQAAIVEAVEQALTIVNELEGIAATKIEAIPPLNQSILAKAFRGELVPQDPNDEPASVLLERIRAERETASPAAGLP